jgi:hypothetical protein
MVMQNAQAWRQAVERGELGVWDLRPPMEAVHHSPQWKVRLGFPNVDEADSTDFWRCRVHPQDLQPMLEAMRAHAEGSRPTYEATFRLRSNGSGYRLLHSRGRVVERDARGRVLRMVGTMVDLTGRPCSPRGGLVEGARSGIAIQPLASPFHTLLRSLGTTACAQEVDAREQVIVLVSDLLNASIEQLLQIGIADR